MDVRVFGALFVMMAWASSAAAQEAPFGLAWGPLSEVPAHRWSTGKRT